MPIDVRVRVVQLVVRVLPLLGRRGLSHSQVVEWIFGSRIQSHWPCRMLWPISMFSRILATHRPAVPTTQAGGKMLSQQHGAAAELELALDVDDLADVRRVGLAAGVEDVLADGVELVADLLDVLGGEVGDRVVGLLLDGSHGLPWFAVECGLGSRRWSVVDVAGAGGGVDAGLDRARRRLPGRGGGELAVAQVAHGALAQRQHAAQQMPIRQPLGIRTPASSAASRIGVAPSASTTVPVSRR